MGPILGSLVFLTGVTAFVSYYGHVLQPGPCDRLAPKVADLSDPCSLASICGHINRTAIFGRIFDEAKDYFRTRYHFCRYESTLSRDHVTVSQTFCSVNLNVVKGTYRKFFHCMSSYGIQKQEYFDFIRPSCDPKCRQERLVEVDEDKRDYID
ncbi:hypothetical protein HDE_13176 [Halotydeus destructor]|nr:hypothetical protein HDE_13176 [Halotydeus destructor]